MTRATSRFLTILGCLILLGCAPIIAYAQVQTQEYRDWERQQRDRQREDREREKRMRDLRQLGNVRGPSSLPPTPGRLYVSPSKLTDEQKAILAPAPQDAAAFAGFLSQPNTGLVRLLPREKYDQTLQMPLRGGGAYYSFSTLSHEASPWSDIKLQDGTLHAGPNDLTLGLMTLLHDEVSLETVALDSVAVKFISQLPSPKKYVELKGEVDRYRTGFDAAGDIYRSTLPAQLNATYLLRSTIFDRVDSVIAFRVIRIDEDGSVTLLWKLLNSLPVKKVKDVPQDY